MFVSIIKLIHQLCPSYQYTRFLSIPYGLSVHILKLFGNEEHSLLGRNLPAQMPRKEGVAKQLVL